MISFDRNISFEDLDKFSNELLKKFEIKEIRFKKFEKWLENNDFDSLMERIKNEHNDEYINKCYKKGYEPYPNNKLNFIIDYIKCNYEPIVDRTLEPDNCFAHIVYFFKGYYFVNIYGQGVITRIYKKNKENGKEELFFQI